MRSEWERGEGEEGEEGKERTLRAGFLAEGGGAFLSAAAASLALAPPLPFFKGVGAAALAAAFSASRRASAWRRASWKVFSSTLPRTMPEAAI